MKMLFAVAALLLASSAAQAQYTFQYGGRTIHVDPDRGTVSIPGVYDNTGKRSKRHNDQDSDRSRKQTPQEAKTDPHAPATEATPAPAPAPAEQTPPATANAPPPPPPVPSTATATVAPADTITSTQPPALTPPPLPLDQPDAAPAKPETPPVVATAPPAPPPVQQAPAQPRDPNSPVGLWLTEEKEGKVRIEPCGANLCGYSVDAKSNANGEQVLINMKPAKDKWTGRIYDPKSGSTYDSTIALKGTDSLRVQGCALGGMFCGGQTWSRLN
jgi:Uncharacterized protein conserved in bacteria (DUF2147)